MMDWDERYSEEGFVYGTTPNDFLVSVADQIPTGGRVLCLAEGEGRNAVWLAEQGFQVTAVDQSSVGLRKAQRLAKERGVQITTVISDLAEFVIGHGRWEAVVSIFCHVPPKIRKGLHRHVIQGLGHGGVLILEAYTPAQIALGTGGPPVPELTMTLDALKEELEDLEIQIGRELERDVVEGRYHTGRGAVVQVLAIKH